MDPNRLHARLLTAIGLTSCLTGCGPEYDNEGGDACLQRSYSRVEGTLRDPAASCPDNPYYAVDAFETPVDAYCEAGGDSGDFGGTTIVAVSLVDQGEGSCSYRIECESTGFCPGGRPVRRDGEAVLASAAPRVDWHREVRPGIEGLPVDERAALAAYWFRAGAEEHSSVAAFHRFAMELMRHGAPATLVAQATRAALDEIGHARDAFALASRYAGGPVGPGPLPLGGEVALAQSLAELAVSTAREGAIGECCAAFLASERLARCADPAVRTVLARIVEEETRHAELAWATLRWALEVGGQPVRTALTAVFAELETTPHHADPTPLGLAAHGLMNEGEERAFVRTCHATLVRPLAVELLAAVAA